MAPPSALVPRVKCKSGRLRGGRPKADNACDIFSVWHKESPRYMKAEMGHVPLWSNCSGEQTWQQLDSEGLSTGNGPEDPELS